MGTGCLKPKPRQQDIYVEVIAQIVEEASNMPKYLHPYSDNPNCRMLRWPWAKKAT